MDILKYIYSLGIVYIVFAILWFFITSLPKFLSGAFENNSATNYLFKSLQYYLIAALTTVHTVDFIDKIPSASTQVPFYITLGGVIIFLYLAGKTDKAIMSVQIQANNSKINLGGALKYEPHIVGVAIVLYFLSFYFPFLMANSVIVALHEGILNFYNTFFIHFIISVVAFFFLFSMLFRGFKATGRLVEFVNHLITGKPLTQRKKTHNPFQNINNMGGFNNDENPFKNIFEQFNTKEEDDTIEEDEYVDFEEVEDDNESK